MGTFPSHGRMCTRDGPEANLTAAPPRQRLSSLAMLQLMDCESDGEPELIVVASSAGDLLTMCCFGVFLTLCAVCVVSM